MNRPNRTDIRTVVISESARALPEMLQRRLYDPFHLQIRYHRPTREATLRATIREDTLPALTRTLNDLGDLGDVVNRPDQPPQPPTTGKPTHRATVSHVLCAPGRTRTCDAGLRRSALCPLSYEGG